MDKAENEKEVKKDEDVEVKNQEHDAPDEAKGITANLEDAEAFDRISKMEELMNIQPVLKGDMLSEAVAFNQTSIFMNYYRVNVKKIALKEGPKAVETILNRVIQGIMEGQLTISDDDGEITVTQTLIHSPTSGNNKLKYAKIQARHKRIMDDHDGQNKKMIAFVSVMTGLPISEVNKIQGSDMGVMDAIAQLFTLV